MSEKKTEETAEEKSVSDKVQDQVNTEDSIAGESGNEETPELTEAEEWKQKHAEVNDKFLRLYSEFENFRRRNAKERIELIGSASADVMKDLLPVVDDFERAIDNNEKSEDAEAIKQGVQLIYQKFKTTLQGKGLKNMDSMETEFDTDLHEAITKIPAPKKKLKGKVVDVIEKGYYLNDKVIRFAKVVVGE